MRDPGGVIGACVALVLGCSTAPGRRVEPPRGSSLGTAASAVGAAPSVPSPWHGLDAPPSKAQETLRQVRIARGPTPGWLVWDRGSYRWWFPDGGKPQRRPEADVPWEAAAVSGG